MRSTDGRSRGHDMKAVFRCVATMLSLSCAAQTNTTRSDDSVSAQARGDRAGRGGAPMRKLPPRSMFPQGDRISKDPCVATAASPDTVDAPGAGAVPGAVPPVVVHGGEVLCLARDEHGAWTPVARAEATTPHLAVKMTKGGGQVMLSVHNASEFLITYRAAMLIRGRWAATNVMPVFPQISGFESWPVPIDALAVYAIAATEYPSK